MRKILLLVILSLASITIKPIATWGATLTNICVDLSGSGDYTDLQRALDAAEENGGPDLIKISQGIFSGGFRYQSYQGYSITVRGGYEPGTGCSARVLDPSATVLDGSGDSPVLTLINSEGGSVTVDGFTIQNGKCTYGMSGGLDVRSLSDLSASDNITVTNNIFIWNYSALNAGGVCAISRGETGSGEIIIINNTSTENKAHSDGGGIYARTYTNSGLSGAITIRGNACIENHTVDNGGGIYAESFSGTGSAGDINIKENACSKNTTGGSGGGMYVYSSGGSSSGKVSIEKNNCTGNFAQESGGVYVKSYSMSGTAGAVLINGNTILGNTADNAIGGLSTGSSSDSGTASSVTLVNNIIAGNTSFISGGVIASSITNIEGNSSGPVILTNNTITQNFGRLWGGAYIHSSNNDVCAYNNIIWENVAYDILIDTSPSYGYNNDYSDLSGIWQFDSNNIDIDPKFVRAGYWDNAGTLSDSSDDIYIAGNYHLLGSSSCVDNGLNTAPEIPDEDFDGNGRILKTNVDIGADEYTQVSLPGIPLLLLE